MSLAADHFAFAIAVTLRHEGDGLTVDTGGATKYGISAKAYPDVDVERLTRAQAAAILRRDYWDALRLHRVDDRDVAAKVFDMAVNLGPGTAVRCAQRAVNYLSRRTDELAVDGVLGPKTLGAINALRPRSLLLALRAYHTKRYVELVEDPDDTRYERFAAGWLSRAMS
jgi:lysozyme family protein